MGKEFPVLETRRLILREVIAEDANNVFNYLSEKDVVKPMGLAPCQTVEDVWDEIKWYKSIYEDGTGIRWGITLKDSGEVLWIS